MELDPLAEVELRVLMSVVVGFRQRVVNFQGGSERGERKQYRDQSGGKDCAESAKPSSRRGMFQHGWGK